MKKRNKILLICGVAAAGVLLLMFIGGRAVEAYAVKTVKREFGRMTDHRYRLEMGKVDVGLFSRSVTISDLKILPDSSAAYMAGGARRTHGEDGINGANEAGGTHGANAERGTHGTGANAVDVTHGVDGTGGAYGGSTEQTGGADRTGAHPTVTHPTVSRTAHGTHLTRDIAALELSAERLMLAGIKYGHHEGRMNLSVKKIRLSSPRVLLSVRKGAHEESGDAAVSRPIRVDLGRIVISRGYVEHRDIDRNDTIRNVIEDFSLETDRLIIHTDSTGKEKFTPGSDTHIRIGRISHMPADESTRMVVDTLRIETAAGRIGAASFGVLPTYEKWEFAHKSWDHKDWIRVKTSRIECAGVDFDRLFRHGTLHIDSVTVSGAEVASFKDRNVRRQEWIKPMYHTVIQNIPLKLDIAKIGFTGVSAWYEEVAPGSKTPGRLTLNDISGEFRGFTNIANAERDYIELSAEGRVMDGMGGMHFNSTTYLPVSPSNARWEVMVGAGAGEMASFNAMATPLANIEIASGRIDSASFHIVGDETKADIELTFRYHDLSVNIMKERGGELSERKTATLLVNELILKRDDTSGETHHGHAERDPYRSPFNFMWKTILSGILKSLGPGF